MPRRFVFRLDPVLEQRKRAEQQHQLRVAELEREKLAIESKLREYQLAIIEGRQALRDELAGIGASSGGGAIGGVGGGRVALETVRAQASSSLHLVAKAQQAALELAGSHQRLTQQRALLIQATAARKAVELLKARRHEEFKLDQRRREHADLDELTVMRHARSETDL
jgi:flagellar biosynthesis chaperone FliJ